MIRPPALPPWLWPMVLALGLGAVGGAVFAMLALPLAWMIGAMTITTAAAMAGLPVRVPPGLRSWMIMILGVLLGSAFSPSILDRLGEWSISFVGLFVYLAVATVIGVTFLRRPDKRGSRLDRVTAYFTAMPGGLNEMVMVGRQMGGDDRTISMVHAVRVMAVVLVVPLTFQMLGIYRPSDRPAAGPGLLAMDPVDALLLASCIAGYPIAKLARLPAAQLLGPMLLSAALHMAGLTADKPPAVLIAAAQVVVGAALGCRFTGLNLRTIGRSVWLAIMLTAIMLTVTLVSALLIDRATGLGLAALILALAPGGLTEMSLIALALHTDVALVASHHAARILIIVTTAPMVFLLWRRWLESRSPPGGGAPAE